ncbi:MAG: hypothetical protein ACOZNI_02740 [Myxococcota bacterium]
MPLIPAIAWACTGEGQQPDDTAPTSDAWEASVLAIGEEVAASGHCPSGPPSEVVRVDGTVEAIEATEPAGLRLFARYYNDFPDGGLDSSALYVAGFPEEVWEVTCEFDHYGMPLFEQPSLVGYRAYAATSEGDINLPAFAALETLTDPWVNIELSATDSAGVQGFADSPGVGSAYGWLCVDVATPSESGYGPSTWSGVLFVHVEEWEAEDAFDPSSVASDYFFRIGEVACAYGEDASYYNDDGCVRFPGACDGYDNDGDGEVDEGADTDRDGNGAADCTEDWDGDGTPNREDGDIDCVDL